MAVHTCPSHPCPICYPQTTGGAAPFPFVAPPSLSQFSDDDIAREYHNRQLRKLGDQSKGVSVPALPAIG